jgi:hypothetical protein
MGASTSRISIRQGYVLVERPDDYEIDLSQQRKDLARIAALCAEANCRKVLALGGRARLKVKISGVDIFGLGKSVAELGLTVAVVMPHDGSKEDERFFEDVVTNRGAAIRFFSNEQEARKWLGID